MADYLEQFSFLPLTFTLKALTPIRLPAYKGSTFRGAFGATFRRVVCVIKKGNCQGCLLKERCPYSYVFETPVPEGASKMRKYPYAPHPFVLVPPLEDRERYEPGQQIVFSLTLIGKGIEYLPYFLYTVQEMGKAGIGKGKGRYTLEGVRERDGREIFSEGQIKVPRPTSWKELLQGEPPEEVTLRFITPLRVRYGERLSNELQFHILFRALLRRISLLFFFHCGGELELDFRGMIERSKGVEVRKSSLRWHDWTRYSHRQRSRIKLGGLLGEVTFRGDLEEFWPFLLLGEHIHVGKGTSFGLGRYEVVTGGEGGSAPPVVKGL